MSKVRAALHAIGAVVVLLWSKVTGAGEITPYNSSPREFSEAQALYRLKEGYALGEIPFQTYEEKVGRIIEGKPEPVIAPPVEIPALPPPKVDKNAALRAKLRAEVEQYQRSNDK